ncbi:MAG: formylmethanofuran dehydrogenase [Methylophilaceae bacterium]
MALNQTKSLVLATCPACGMLCDDINANDAPTSTCEKSIAFFTQNAVKSTPRIAGKQVNLSEAIAKVTAILKPAKQVLLAGLSTDLAGFRSAYQLADKTNAALAHMNATTTWRNLKVLQSTGWQTTTLTEVKNRADVIVCIGTDVVKHNPRFFERIVWPKKAMFVKNEGRDVIYLGGKGLDTSHGVSPKGKRPTVLPCDPIKLPEVTAALHALVAGKTLNTKQVAGITIKDLVAIAERLKQAKYAVLIWIAKDLDFPHAELTIQQITQTVVTLNETTRAGALAMGGSDGDTTVNYAHTWLSGLAIDQEVLPEHDALIWVNSFSPEKTVPDTGTPTVVIGNPNMKFDNEPDVFIPIATPGLDCAGTMIRVDSNVILPLKQVRETQLPTLAEVFLQVEAAL